MGKILYDMSGEMDGYEFTDAPQDVNEPLPPVSITINHFDRCNPETSVGGISSNRNIGYEWAGYFDGQDYYELNINNINNIDPDNPIFEKIHQELPSYPGITLSTWLRFPENIEDGYIFCATEETGEKGFYLKVENERLVFYLGLDGSVNNSVSYQIVPGDLDNGNASNDRWIHVVAVWSPEEYLQFYINGEAKVPVTSGVIDKYYSASDVQYFIGRGFDKNEPYFKGCIENIKWYAGVIKHKFIESQYYEGNYPDAPSIPDPINWGSAYRHLIVNCHQNGSINYNFTNYRYSTLNEFDSHTFYLTKNAFLKFLDLIPEPGYEPMMTFQGAQIDIKTEWRWGDLHPISEDDLDNNNSIVVYFNELPDYVPGIDYESGDRVIANSGRIYECLTRHGPSVSSNPNDHYPPDPSITLFDYYWVEIWQSGFIYQGDITGGDYNRSIVQYPYYSGDGNFKYYRCEQDHISSEINNPEMNTSEWKSTEYIESIDYNIGDIALTPSTYNEFHFRCRKENGPGTINGIQEPLETENINEYWSSVWSPQRRYVESFVIVEYEGTLYFNIIDPIVGEFQNPTYKNYWLKISNWNSGVSYQKTNIVEIFHNGEARIVRYVCYNDHISSNVNNPEDDDGTNWRRFYLYPNTSIQNVYYEGEIVVTHDNTDNKLYRCTADGDNKNPDDYPDQYPGSPGCTFWEIWYQP